MPNCNPAGEQRAEITLNFLRHKMHEYEHLKQEIAELEQERANHNGGKNDGNRTSACATGAK